MTRGMCPARPPTVPRGTGWTTLCAAVALAGCVTFDPMPIDPAKVDHVEVRGPVRDWKRVAVLPFDGAPEHRRPAAEYVAVTLGAARKVEVVGPFAVARASAAAPESPSSLAAAGRDPRSARELAARLGADAL